MSYLLNEEKNEGVIILDKKKNILFCNADNTSFQLILDYGIDNLIKLHNNSSFAKGFQITVDNVISSDELGYVLTFKKDSSQIDQVLSSYKDENSGVYNASLIEDIKSGIFSFNLMKNYSVIFIKVNNLEDITDGLKNITRRIAVKDFEMTIAESIRDVDIPIRYYDNNLIIITPAMKKEHLYSFLYRIKNALLQNSLLMNINISIGVASKQSEISFLDVLHNAEKNMYSEDSMQKLLGFEKEADISNRIEKVRQELHSMIINNNMLFSDEIVEMSQYLDMLLVKHIRDLGGECNGRRQSNIQA